MDALEQFLKDDNFARHVNVELLEAANGTATARMTLQEYHLNTHKTVHGAALFTLADAVLSAASNSHGIQAVAINATISFLKAASSGTLTAIATETSLNNTLGVYDIRITAEDGELIAVFQGMVYRKKNRIDGK